jgi:hypothetical protein
MILFRLMPILLFSDQKAERHRRDPAKDGAARSERHADGDLGLDPLTARADRPLAQVELESGTDSCYKNNYPLGRFAKYKQASI